MQVFNIGLITESAQTINHIRLATCHSAIYKSSASGTVPGSTSGDESATETNSVTTTKRNRVLTSSCTDQFAAMSTSDLIKLSAPMLSVAVGVLGPGLIGSALIAQLNKQVMQLCNVREHCTEKLRPVGNVFLRSTHHCLRLSRLTSCAAS